MHKPRLVVSLGTASLILVVMLANPIACSSTSTNDDGSTRFTVNNLGKDISLSSGVMKEIVFSESYDVENYGGPFGSIKMDLQAHLSSVSIAVPGAKNKIIPFPLQSIRTANAAIEGSQLFIRVARAEQEATVCSVGELYGPFDIAMADNFEPVSVTPSSAEASQQTLDIINTGGYSMCVQIFPVITGVADLNSLIVDFGVCDEPAVDIQGTWEGSYFCEGVCDSADDVFAISLEITQSQNDMSIASYTDGEATYQGRVCGGRFSFSGGIATEYDESGTFVLNGDGSASKTSDYLSLGEGAFCSGRCTDTLVRQK